MRRKTERSCQESLAFGDYITYYNKDRIKIRLVGPFPVQ